MKALLVHPDYPDTFWSFKDALKLVNKSASEPPLGLLTVAAMLPETWQLKLVDMKVTALTDDDLRWADLVFIGAMTIQLASAREVIQRACRWGATVVAGGPLFTTCPDDFPDVDHFVLGEAEATLPRFLSDLAAGTLEPRYEATHPPNLKRSPIPRYDLIDINQYATMDLQYSRGCPYDCEFCEITALFGHKVRTKTTAQILGELQAIHDRGWRGTVFFVDDNFIGNKVRLRQDVLPALVEFMKARRYPFPLTTQLSVDLADDPDLMALMVEAGFAGVFVGIETPDPAGLAECGKDQNIDRNLLHSVRRIQAAGLEVKAGFIIGFDSDRPTIFEQMSRFIRESGIVTAMVGLLNAPRGTRLHERLAAEGRLRTEVTGDNTDGSLNFEPRMERTSLLAGYSRVLRNVYAVGPYYDRVRGFLGRFAGAVPRRRVGRLQPGDIASLMRSVYALGIRGQGRRQYWRLFWETLLRRPRMFSLAMTYAVYGHHFRRVYRHHLQADGPA